jgi:hypothetical protein
LNVVTATENERNAQMPKCPNAPVTMSSLGQSLISLQFLFLFSGCTESTVASSLSRNPVAAVSAEHSETELTFDAGMFFIDEPSYVCIPFERLGISEDRNVVAVVSSCECIVPTIVRYQSGAQKSKSAVRFDLKAESKTESKGPMLASLGVKMTIKFDSTEDLEFIFVFQHAKASFE